MKMEPDGSYNLGFNEGEQAGILEERSRFKQLLRQLVDELNNKYCVNQDGKLVVECKKLEELIGVLCK